MFSYQNLIMGKKPEKKDATEKDRKKNVNNLLNQFNEAELTKGDSQLSIGDTASLKSEDSASIKSYGAASIRSDDSASIKSGGSERSEESEGSGASKRSSNESLKLTKRQSKLRIRQSLHTVSYETDEFEVVNGKTVLRSRRQLEQYKDVPAPSGLDYSVGFYRPTDCYLGMRAEYLGTGELKKAELCEGNWIRRMLHYAKKRNIWPPSTFLGMYISSGYYYDYYLKQHDGKDVDPNNKFRDDDGNYKNRKGHRKVDPDKQAKITNAPPDIKEIPKFKGKGSEAEYIRIPKTKKKDKDKDKEKDKDKDDSAKKRKKRKDEALERVHSYVDKLEAAEEEAWANEKNKETDMIEVYANPKKNPERRVKRKKQKEIIEIRGFEDLDFKKFSNNRLMLSAIPHDTKKSFIFSLIRNGEVESFDQAQGTAMLKFERQIDAARFFNTRNDTKIEGKSVGIRPVLLKEVEEG